MPNIERDVALAIKTSRELALLPYLVRTLAADKGGARRGRGPGRPGERPAPSEESPALNGDSDAAPDAVAGDTAFEPDGELV